MAHQERLSDEDDPAIGKFLDFLANDIETFRLEPVPPELVARAMLLVDGVKIDLNKRLADDL